jgi:uncharacterized RDD family membrane protein YckC
MNNSQYPGGQGQGQGGWGQPGANQPPGNYPPPSYGQAPYGYGYAPQVTTRYAGFWIRFVAYLIDGILLSVVTSPIAFGIGNAFILSVVYAVIFVAYFVLTAMYLNGASLGKKLLGLRVANQNGTTPEPARIALRYLIGYPISGLIFCLGFIWIGFDGQKQGWHDKIFSTYVVKG